MKQKLLLKTMLLLFALIAGSSSVWAIDDTQVVFTLNDADAITALGITLPNAGNGTAVTSLSKGGVNIACTHGSTNTRIYQGGGGNAGKYDFRIYSGGGSLTFTAGTYHIKGITIEGNNLGNLSGSGYSNGSWTGSAASVTLTATATATIYTITVTYGEAATTVATPSISGVTPFWPTTEVSISCGTDGATIQYSTDDGANWTNYSTPFTLNATTTVKAKATKTGLTDSEIANKTFTKATVLTVSQALTAIDALANNGTIADQFVTGIVSQIDAYGSNAITYWISDDGTTTSQLEVFKGKGLNGANFSAITDLTLGDEVVVNGTLQKYVKNSTTTPEFTSGSQLLSLITKVKTPTFSPAAGAVAAGTEVAISTTTEGATIYYTTNGTNPTTESSVYSDPIVINSTTTLKAIAVKDGFNNSDVAEAEYTVASTQTAIPTFLPAAGTYASAQNVTISTDTDGATIYYTTDGTDPTTESSVYDGAINVNKNMTIKAIATKDGLLNSDIAEAAYIILTAIPFVETFNTNTGASSYSGGNDGNWSGSIATGSPVNSDNSGWTFDQASGASQCIKLGKGGAKGSATTPTLAFESGKTYLLTFRAGAWNGGSEGTTLNLSITNGTLSSASVTMVKGTFTNYSITITGTTDAGTITFAAKNSSNNRFFLDEVQVREVVAITPAKTYTTLTAASALDFTGLADLEAYIVKDNDTSDGYVTLTKVNKVPANTGLVLKASSTGSPIDVPVLTGDADDVTGNKMKGSATATTAVAANAGYILKDGVFQPSSGGDLPAGKAYLNIPYSASAPVLNLSFDGEGNTTGIDMVKGEGFKVNGEFYNLNGQRVAQPTKGLYIVNGKKVVIK